MPYSDWIWLSISLSVQLFQREVNNDNVFVSAGPKHTQTHIQLHSNYNHASHGINSSRAKIK